jgi:hypothetical protein
MNTRNPDSAKFVSPMSAGVTRNNTQIIPARPSPNATIGGPANQIQVRGLNIRKLDTTDVPHVPPKGAHLN